MKKRTRISWRIVEAAVVLLFWMQAVRVLFSTLFGVIYDALFDDELSFAVVGLVFACLLLALLAPAVLDRRSRPGSGSSSGRMPMFVIVLLVAVARVPLTLNIPNLRLAASIVVLGAAGIYLALLLRKLPQMLPVALVLALVADQIARAYGDTWDFSLQPVYLPLQIVFCLGLIGVAWTVYTRRDQPEPAPDDGAPCMGIGGGLALGAFLFLQTTVLAQANVVARWTGAPYELLTPALLLATVLPLLPVAGSRFSLFGGRPLQWLLGQGVLVRALILWGGGLLGLIVGRHVEGWLGAWACLLVQLLLVGALPLLFARPVECDRQPRTGWPLALGMVVFLCLQLAFAFAFTYPYTVPQFRNAGLPIILAAAALALLPAALRSPEILPDQPAPMNSQLFYLFGLVFVAMLIWAEPDPLDSNAPAPSASIKVATYNIHYGYDTNWGHALEEQAQAIERSGADVIFLQEVDAGRSTSYGVDNALWLARRLRMQAVFAPALEGLSGVALLTRLPIEESDWFLLPSELEQTALVHAQLSWGQDELHVYGVWLGLDKDERMRQLSAALELMDDGGRIVFGGDLNSEPQSPVYETIQAAGFVDPFVIMENLPAFSSPAVRPEHRIDYVWAKGLEPVAAEVSSSLASDHRLLVVSLAPAKD